MFLSQKLVPKFDVPSEDIKPQEVAKRILKEQQSEVLDKQIQALTLFSPSNSKTAKKLQSVVEEPRKNEEVRFTFL